MAVRNAAYEFRWRETAKVEVPVISIGNLTTGGTGKTPIVAAVVKMLQDIDQRPGIVSRGYKADSSGENDEKRVLNLKCPGVPHRQNPDRIVASLELLSEQDVSAIVLDDGFQHRRIHRDLDIVLIDATNPFGFDHLLPRGLLRESLAGLRRADFVLITRANQTSPERLDEIREKCVRSNPRLEDRMADVSFEPSHLIDGASHQQPVSEIHASPVFVMTGIGNPDAFVQTCRELGPQIVGTRFFPDHHHFTSAEVNSVAAEAAALDARILTTVKDLVKIANPPAGLLAVDIEARFCSDDDQNVLRELLSQTSN